MPMPRLTKVITFKRIKADAARDNAGQVDETVADNWERLGQRRAEAAQDSSGEAYGDDQVRGSSQWSFLVRGDNFTRSILRTDRIEHIAHGKLMTLNITGITTTQDVPHVLEFTAEEQ